MGTVVVPNRTAELFVNALQNAGFRQKAASERASKAAELRTEMKKQAYTRRGALLDSLNELGKVRVLKDGSIIYEGDNPSAAENILSEINELDSVLFDVDERGNRHLNLGPRDAYTSPRYASKLNIEQNLKLYNDAMMLDYGIESQEDAKRALAEGKLPNGLRLDEADPDVRFALEIKAAGDEGITQVASDPRLTSWAYSLYPNLQRSHNEAGGFNKMVGQLEGLGRPYNYGVNPLPPSVNPPDYSKDLSPDMKAATKELETDWRQQEMVRDMRDRIPKGPYPGSVVAPSLLDPSLYIDFMPPQLRKRYAERYVPDDVKKAVAGDISSYIAAGTHPKKGPLPPPSWVAAQDAGLRVVYGMGPETFKQGVDEGVIKLKEPPTPIELPVPIPTMKQLKEKIKSGKIDVTRKKKPKKRVMARVEEFLGGY
jgi:hypothetical protein